MAKKKRPQIGDAVPNNIVTRFGDDLESCHDRICRLLHREAIWIALNEAVGKWDALRAHGEVANYVKDSFVALTAMTLRTLVDRDERSASFFWLAAAVVSGQRRPCDEASFATDARLVNPDDSRWDDKFREILPPDLTKRGACDQLQVVYEAFEKETEIIRIWANKQIAHADRKGSGVVTFGELYFAIEFSKRLLEFFYAIATPTHRTYLRSFMIDPAWKAALEQPWIQSRSHEGLCTPVHLERGGPPWRWRRIERYAGVHPKSPDSIHRDSG